ncbi:uncharacterized protein [Nicotiana tomentosiformis]|uniref:uncharacterized protein n=1 Tax=Nicotiana tomentosiformis TaxID=4098 RepID=UPI00388C7099
MDGQSGCTIQILEDMLCASVIDFEGSWDQFSPLAEFAYNTTINQASRWLHMRPYMGGDVVLQLVGQSRQKSYADRRDRDVSYMVGEKVLLRVLPMKGVMRFGKKGKLSPQYISPFDVLERVGEVAYRLALPPSLTGVHPVFHVSMFRKYYGGPSYVLDFIPVQLDKDLTYVEELVAILDRQVRKLMSKNIASMKVQWRGQPAEEAT